MKLFEFSKLKEHTNVLILSPRKSGKSTLSNKLIKYLDTDVSIIMSNIPYMDYPVYPGHEVIKFNTEQIKENTSKQQKVYIKNREFLKLLFVFEECMSDRKLFDDADVHNIYNSGRNDQTNVILIEQYFSTIPRQILKNIRYVFVSRGQYTTLMKYEKKYLYENYFGVVDSFDEFNKIFDNVTKDPFNFLVVDRYADKTEEALFIVPSNCLKDQETIENKESRCNLM